MADPKDPTPYPVAPDPEPDPGGDPAGSGGGQKGPPRPRGRIDEPSLLEEFDEDVDFSSDPELEAALIAGARGDRPGAATPASPPPAAAKGAPPAAQPGATPPDALVKPDVVPDRFWAIGAIVALLVAITEALIWREQGRWAHVGLTIYGAALNTGLGLAAIYLAARLLERPLGDFERAGARVAFAACLWQVAAQLQIHLVGSRANQIEELVLALAVYTLAMWGLFRWRGRTLGFVLGLHFMGWLLIQAGASLQSCAARAAVGA